MSHKKGIVLIANICTVLLGLEGDPSKAFLIVPKDTDIEAMVPLVEKRLDRKTLKAKFINAQGEGLIRVFDRDERRSLRVCVLVNSTQKYQDVAKIYSAGNSITDVIANVNIESRTVRNVTEQLCRDFWKDVWFGNVWENKKTQGGAITHQRAMHRLATLPDSNVCANVYEHGDRGKFYNKTCPGGDLHVVVLYSYIGNFDKTPPHVAFYIVLQYWGENTRVILYIVYPAANTTPTMRITNSRLMSQLRDRALAQVRTERSKGQFPAPWMAQGFHAAEMGLVNNTMPLWLP